MFLLFLAVFGNAGCSGRHSSNLVENTPTPIYEPDPEPTQPLNLHQLLSLHQPLNLVQQNIQLYLIPLEELK